MSTPRPEHAPVMKGKVCVKCGLAPERHRTRARVRGDYFRRYNKGHGQRRGEDGPRPIIAIDGEGYTLKSGAHRYTYMAACDEKGLVSEVHDKRGLRAEQVFKFLCALPKGALLVGFSLGYDRTKWVESWPDQLVWELVDPDRRKDAEGHAIPRTWGGYRVNVVATRTSIKSLDTGERRTLWDVWKFFQSSFVKALSKWDIGTRDERKRIEAGKARRGSFKSIGPRERRYCQTECRLLAQLMRALLDAHEAVGLKLTTFYGPGSTASIILKEHGDQRAVYPRMMAEAVLSAYFGGRFECSHVGPVKPLVKTIRGKRRQVRQLYAYDIASAYPAAMCRLPCLRAGHGKWVYRKGMPRTRKGSVALCSYVVEPHLRACQAWGPLPHRLPDGNIVFPVAGAGGWAWDEEVRAAQELHPGVRVSGAWVWERKCKCPPPFAARIKQLYEWRLRVGKGGKGIVIKLALNSLYGKSAQRVGAGKFRCMVRAGLITSMTRAALLRAVKLARDPWNVLELATDSALSREPLKLEAPGLGGWERKPWVGGAFLMRPGLRFALSLGKEHTAARGISGKVLHKNRARVLRQWKRRPMAPVTLQTPSFFHGARLSVRRVGAGTEERPYAYNRAELYGKWTDEKKTLKYVPGPKRSAVEAGYRLTPWELPRGKAFRSVPYGQVGQSAMADGIDEMREREEDQPEAGLLRML